MSLARAGAFLLVASARNRVRRALGRLRNPRYLVGSAAFLLYLWSLLARPGRRWPAAPALWNTRLALETVLPLAALAVVAWAWLLASGRPALTFDAAEVQWLFPAPVSRRALLRYKVVRGLIRILFGSAMTVLFARSGGAGAVLGLGVAGFIAFGTLWLHRVGASLTRARWELAPHGGVRRAAWTGLGLAAAAAAFAVALHRASPPSSPWTAGAGEFLAWTRILFGTFPLDLFARPVQAVVRIAVASHLAAALAALPLALGVFLAHLGWVLTFDVPFEESAVASAEQRARMHDPRRPRGRWPIRAGWTPWRLRSGGPPERALTWKNLLAVQRVFGVPFVLVLGFTLVGVSIAVAGAAAGQALPRVEALRLVVAWLAGASAVLSALFGPLALRADLRTDLQHLDLLKAMPLTGRQVVQAELLAPVCLLASVQAGLIALSVCAGWTLEAPGFPPLVRLGWALGALLLVPSVTAAMVAVQNAAALLFPDWLGVESRGPRGFEAIGQRLLTLAATLLVLGTAVVPAAIVGGALGWTSARLGLGPFAPTVGCLGAAAVLLAELSLGIRWMGLQYERLDPATG